MERPLAIIVEDDPDLSTVFAEAVQAAGFASETIYNGTAALKRLEGTAPRLLVLDLHLPGVTGDRILDFVNEQPHLAGVQVIVASADDRSAQALYGKASLVLLKPISFIQLRDLAGRFITNEG
jgi:two-component system, OmpR family, response regulator